MANNEETISDLEIEVEESEITETEKVSETVLVLEIFRSALRAILLSIIVLVLLRLDSIVTGEFSTVIMSFFTEMVSMVLLLIISGTAVVGVLAFLNNRINLSYEKREELNKIISHIDLIVSSVLVSVSLFFLPSVFDWVFKLNSGFQSSMIEQLPGYPIYGLQVMLAFISRFIIFEIVAIISIVFLYGAIFYRFATRILRFLDAENKFTLTYIERSGKSYLYAMGLMIGYTFVALDSISSDILVVYLMVFTLPFALGQRFLAKTTLEKNGKAASEIMETPVDRLTKWYSFATKRAYRWLILIGIFISLTTLTANLIAPFYGSFVVHWGLVGFSAIAAVGFSTLYFVVRYIAVVYGQQESAIGKRIRIESAGDLIISAMVFVVALSVFLTEIGPTQWALMQQDLIISSYYPYMPYFQFQVGLIATLWQGWMILLLLAMILRLLAVSRSFTDRYYVNERRNNKLVARSGKILIVATASLLSVKLMLSGILYFGFLTDVQVFLLLTLIILQTVVSQIRMREIDLAGEIVK